ncbi:hypothetical protein [Pseudobutyrivibrio sp. LB2011]|uniref:hypothetical protein n=1 Tax=Pseudobutyrivibrio sp. LB2011 TaxID=1408312 RepID=UPI0005D21101|nr:hypothetical protein [Pseudobutyrivibrio sp. LB2011]
MGLFGFLFNNTGDDNSYEEYQAEEEYFYGVSKSELNEIAESCRYGSYVTIGDECLYYHFKSGRGHQTNHQEFIVRDGKLHAMCSGGYPGQLNFPDIKFMNICNERYDFY